MTTMETIPAHEGTEAPRQHSPALAVLDELKVQQGYSQALLRRAIKSQEEVASLVDKLETALQEQEVDSDAIIHHLQEMVAGYTATLRARRPEEADQGSPDTHDVEPTPFDASGLMSGVDKELMGDGYAPLEADVEPESGSVSDVADSEDPVDLQPSPEPFGQAEALETSPAEEAEAELGEVEAGPDTSVEHVPEASQADAAAMSSEEAEAESEIESEHGVASGVAEENEGAATLQADAEVDAEDVADADEVDELADDISDTDFAVEQEDEAPVSTDSPDEEQGPAAQTDASSGDQEEQAGDRQAVPGEADAAPAADDSALETSTTDVAGARAEEVPAQEKSRQPKREFALGLLRGRRG